MNKHNLPLMGAALALLLSTGACKKDEGGAPAAPAAPGVAQKPAASEKKDVFGTLTLDEVETRVKAAKEGKDKFFVFDNNSKERWAESHVPSAKWVDFASITAADLPAEKDASLVFYCANEY